MSNAKKALERNGVTIKGTRDGLTVHIPSELLIEKVLSNLTEKFDSDVEFFQGAEVEVDLGPRPFQEEEFKSFCSLFETHGIYLKGILSDNPVTKLLAQNKGIMLCGDRSIMSSRVRVDHPVKIQRMRNAKFLDGEIGLSVWKTIRGGQKVRFAGDITILGDVNPGAELLCTGNIVVFGSLRGVAHAGAEGNRDAVVAALDLRPTQLRIADCIGRSPERLEEEQHLPEIARIQDGNIVIELYESYQRSIAFT